MKISNFYKYLLASCLSFYCSIASAQSWADKPKTFLENIKTGLISLGAVVATILLVWVAYEIMWGGKRLQDCKNWVIGAIIFGGASGIVAIFFG